MEYTTLGQTDLRVSRIAFGTWSFGGEWGAVQEAAASAALRRALDLGITLFDTAQAYGFGASERLLSRALRPELTGAMTETTTFPPDDWRSTSPLFHGDTFRANLARVAALQRFAQERGAAVGQLAIAWALANPAVDVAIVGARNPRQIEQTAPAAALHLTRDELTAIERLMRGAVPVGGPAPEAMPEAA